MKQIDCRDIIWTDQIFCIRQILEKKGEYKGTVHQLFIDFKKAYDSVRREGGWPEVKPEKTRYVLVSCCQKA
jgi:hypothetical protein